MKLNKEKKRMLISQKETGSAVAAVSCLTLANYAEK